MPMRRSTSVIARSVQDLLATRVTRVRRRSILPAKERDALAHTDCSDMFRKLLIYGFGGKLTFCKVLLIVLVTIFS
jgi:hypothetical protein